MSDFTKKIIHDLSKKYVYENFDFKAESPEDLLKFYQETAEKITKVIEDQNDKLAEENLKSFLNFNM